MKQSRGAENSQESSAAYRRGFLNSLGDSANWPSFSTPSFLEKLNLLADRACAKRSIHGYLAALIYHQICEEMAKLLLECAHFHLQCAFFPLRVRRRTNRRQMFGQLLDELEQGVMLPGLEAFTHKCREFNGLRISIVHKLATYSSLTQIRLEATKAKGLFDEAFEAFDAVYDDYRVIFHGYAKDVESLEELGEQ